MPYFKSKPIHAAVDKTLRYILNPDKTSELLYADSINCFTDTQAAYLNMKQVYEHFSGRSFTEGKSKNGNSPIKALHLIQSFSPEDGVTPEEVHRIGLELVKKMYGDKVQAVIATHVDKEHIHNHVCVNTYTLDGKKLYNTISEVVRARAISDVICKLHGVRNVMLSKARKKGKSMSYCEWLHRRTGTSWKAKICAYIDTIIPVAESLEHLMKIMRTHGYTVKEGKYISVLAPGQQRAIRLKKLGEGYDEKSIAERIACFIAGRPKEWTPDEILRTVIREFTDSTFKIGFAQSVKDTTAELGKRLALINNERISSVGEVEGRLQDAEKEIAKLNASITDLEADLQHKQLLSAAAKRYFRKYRLGEKHDDYPGAQKKQDKLILEKNGIKALSDTFRFDDDVKSDSIDLEKLKTKLAELTDKTETYRSIIETCRDKNDFITKIHKEVERRLTEQEQDKIAAMKADRFRIYRPAADYDDTFDDGGPAPNVDDCDLLVDSNMFEVREKGSESEDLGERLEAAYRFYNLRVGDLIAIGDLAYRVNKKGYSVLKTFTRSRAEKERERQEELDREERERLAEEERRIQQEEQERKKAEEKQKEQTTQPKKKNKTL